MQGTCKRGDEEQGIEEVNRIRSDRINRHVFIETKRAAKRLAEEKRSR